MAQANHEIGSPKRFLAYAMALGGVCVAISVIASLVYLSAADPGVGTVQTTDLAAKPSTMNAASDLAALAGGGVLSIISFAWVLQRR